MPKLTTDAPQRERALDPSASFIVQAPAGSGKTGLLIQRFLSLLAKVDQPESIMAITFTRKAAGEMRHRILQALERVQGPEPEKEHERRTWLLARAALARDNALGWRIGENPARLRIQTIDSLCASLVRRMPWLSRFGATPGIEEDPAPLYREAARATIASLESDQPLGAAAAIECLLRHLDNNAGNLEKLLVQMLGKRDQWLRHVKGLDRTQARSALEDALRSVIRDSLAALRDSLPANTAREVAALACFAARNLIGEGRDSLTCACESLTDLPGADPASLPEWLGIAAMLLTGKGERRKRATVSDGFPPYAKAEKARYDELALPAAFVERLAAVRGLPPPAFDEAQWEVVEALLDLLPLLVAQLRLAFRENGSVDYIEIAQAARLALGSPEEPTDLAFALDYRLHHLLVDEFQDTSHGQFELLKSLTAEWQPGDGRTLFAVGDPMQSIYRFREADVSLFLDARQRGIGTLSLEPLTLSVNFRSDAGVVQWINEAFREAFPAEEDGFTGAVPYSPSVAHHAAAEAQAVTIHPFLEDSREEEAARVVEIVRDVRGADPEGSIAVLVRSRSHLAFIVPRLQQTGLRFRAIEIDPLAGRPVVQDLQSLTRALLHLADRPAWLAILRAPWCGLTLADLLALTGNDRKGIIWDAVNEDARFARLTEDGRTRLARFRAVIAQSLALRGRLPLRGLVESAWLALGGPACLEDRAGIEDASAYLDLLEGAAAGCELPDPAAFAEQVDKLYGAADPEADGKLQLLSIHKAKGLEFDTVIVPGLARGTRGDEARLLDWLERVNAGGRTDLLLGPIKAAGAEDDPIQAYLKSIERQKAANESTRLLYVAATRARKRLHLLGHATLDAKGELRTPGTRTLLYRIWHAVMPHFAGLSAPQPHEAAVEVPEPVVGHPLRRLDAAWIMPEMPPEVSWLARAGVIEPLEDDEPERVGELERVAGTVAHAFLERTAGQAEPRWDAASIRAALLDHGVFGNELEDAAAKVRTALENTWTDERGRWILAPHHEQRNEYAISGVFDGQVRRLVIDRTFVDEDGVRWIIDYKTSPCDAPSREAFLDEQVELYRRQLEDYAAVLRSIEQRPIRVGLYYPLFQGWREWTPASRPARQIATSG